MVVGAGAPELGDIAVDAIGHEKQAAGENGEENQHPAHVDAACRT